MTSASIRVVAQTHNDVTVVPDPADIQMFNIQAVIYFILIDRSPFPLPPPIPVHSDIAWIEVRFHPSYNP